MKNSDKYGSWAVVTGASSGIGRAFASQLSQQGQNIVLVARDAAKLEETAEVDIQTQSKILSADLSSPQGQQKLIDATQGLDVGLLVHAAGITHAGKFLDTPDATNEGLLRLNMDATVALSKAYGQQFKDRSGRGLILVSSGLAYAPVPYLAVYSAAKAFVFHFGEALAEELRPSNVDVLTVLPGGTKTEMADKLGDMIDFDKVAMPMGAPDAVAQQSLKALGKADSVSPGLMNKIMAVMMARLMGRKRAKRMLGKMLGGALREGSA